MLDRQLNSESFFQIDNAQIVNYQDDMTGFEKDIKILLDSGASRKRGDAIKKTVALSADELLNGSLMGGKSFNEFLSAAAASESLAAIVVVQLEGQQELIEMFGEQFAEGAVNFVENCLRINLRESDFVERLSLSQVAVVLTDLHTEKDAVSIASHLAEVCEGEHFSEDMCFVVKLTTGLSLLPDDLSLKLLTGRLE